MPLRRLNAVRKRYKKKVEGDSHLRELLTGSSIGLTIRVLGAILGYAFTLMITRNYGAVGMGIYALSLSVLNLGGLLGKFGLDVATMRMIATYAGNKEWGLIKKLSRISFLYTLLIAGTVSLVLLILAPVIADKVFGKHYLTPHFRVAAIGIFPFVLMSLYAQSLRGLKQITSAIFLQFVSVTLIGALLLGFFILMDFKQPGIPLYSYLGGVVLSLLLGYELWKSALTKLPQTTTSQMNIIPTGKFLEMGFHMMLSGSLLLLMGWIDRIMLGMFTTESDVGIYTVALRIAALSTIPSVGINSIGAPKFAELFGSQKLVELKRLVKQTSKLLFWITLPILGVCLLFPNFILSLFGKGFNQGVMALTYLCLGRLVGASCGLIAPLIRMVGKERVLNLILLVATLLNIVLNYLLIPRYGINGAAIASMFSLIFWNLAGVIYARWTLGISSLYLPLLAR
ncbi:MAG: hypothetical protein D6748_10670 [Calditrichaeota bacterium]|nr:MAG: hypothetical protein D6748_10670 [Calditrichota bacterium]